MPDDIPRPAHEKTPDQRHDGVPPSWWRALSRTDLPVGPGEAAFSAITSTHERAPEIRVVDAGAPRVQSWLRVARIASALLLVLAVVISSAAVPVKVIGGLMATVLALALVGAMTLRRRDGHDVTPPRHT